jgi:hypothetical protein
LFFAYDKKTIVSDPDPHFNGLLDPDLDPKGGKTSLKSGKLKTEELEIYSKNCYGILCVIIMFNASKI